MQVDQTEMKVALDFNLSPKLATALTALYGQSGFEFVHLKEVVASTTPDVLWATTWRDAGGRFVMSGDISIARKPHEAAAFIDSGLISIFPDKGWGSLRIHQQAALLVYHWPGIADQLGGIFDGSCWKLPVDIRGQGLRLRPARLIQLQVPDEILDRHRQTARAISV
ncbi:hypothetical protein P7L66_08745 [Tistrella mobilis]|uniref:PIN-like domain-containing protein n=1 Tax=Tistrella mobilis TaxID=171437 RepID=UPI003556519A